MLYGGKDAPNLNCLTKLRNFLTLRRHKLSLRTTITPITPSLTVPPPPLGGKGEPMKGEYALPVRYVCGYTGCATAAHAHKTYHPPCPLKGEPPPNPLGGGSRKGEYALQSSLYAAEARSSPAATLARHSFAPEWRKERLIAAPFFAGANTERNGEYTVQARYMVG